MTSSAPDLDIATAADPWAAAVLLHPHPDYGGDRFNVVVDGLFRRLPREGVTAVRFDFASSDTREAAEHTAGAIEEVASGEPVFLVGYSFGGDVATTVDDPRLAGWFLIAPPLSLVAAADVRISTDPRPKHLAVPEHDQFSPPDRASTETASWVSTTIDTVVGSDHFFGRPGAVGAVADRLVAWLREIVQTEGAA